MPEPTPPHGAAEHGATGPVNPAVRFERKDIRTRGVVLAAAAIIVFSVIVHLVFFGYFMETIWGRRPPGPMKAFISQERVRLPADLKKVPSPRIQVNQARDMEELRQYEAQFLDDYGWVDRKKGVVRIPVARALELLSDPKAAAANGIRVRPKAGEGR
jgi:hypothetical protein